MNNKTDFDVLQIIENDEYFSSFLQPGANSTLTKSMTITEQVKKLSDGIDLLSKELQAQVLENHQDLLLQANHANKLESVLSTMNYHVQNLFANAEKLKSQIHKPYQAINNHTRILGRLHVASHVLRQVHRIQQLSKRLASISGDPVQQATVLRELEQLGADSDVAEVEVVVTEVRKTRAAQQRIVKLATDSLTQAVACGNGVQATTAIQIFINLDRITTATENLIGIALDECQESLRTAFGIGISLGSSGSGVTGTTGPGHVSMVNAQSQGFRKRLWSDVDKAIGDEIFQQCKQIKFLQTTLNHMNCSQFKFIAKQFWEKLNEIFITEMNKASASVQQMLVDDYPKVLKSYYSMSQKLNYNEFVYSRYIFDKFEVSYLTGSLNKLLETTQNMFSVETIAPSHDQIDALMRILTNELTVALVENELMEKSSKNIAKCVNMFAVRTEQKLATGSDAAQVIGGAPNTGQQQNVQLANALYYLSAQIQRSLTNLRGSLTENCVRVINDSVHDLDNLTNGLLQPLIVSINQTVETIVITMHEEDWRRESRSTTTTTCSAYLRELLQFLTRVHHTYLLHFDNKPVLTNKCNDVAIHAIELLVRHASIVGPMNTAGRIRLRADLTALERHLRSSMPAPSLCPHLSDLGAPYRLLKSAASLVGLATATELPVQTVASVQTSTLLFMMFGHAQPTGDLLPPHKTLGWTVLQLSVWLDRHPNEGQRLDLIAGALQRYETLVRHTHSKNFDPVYPILSELLAKAVKSIHT